MNSRLEAENLGLIAKRLADDTLPFEDYIEVAAEAVRDVDDRIVSSGMTLPLPEVTLRGGEALWGYIAIWRSREENRPKSPPEITVFCTDKRILDGGIAMREIGVTYDVSAGGLYVAVNGIKGLYRAGRERGEEAPAPSKKQEEYIRRRVTSAFVARAAELAL